MRLICNGYVDDRAGSVCAASHLALEQLLRRGHEIVFVSTPTFVYPSELLAVYSNLSYVPAVNPISNGLHMNVGLKFSPALPLTGPLNEHFFAKTFFAKARAIHSERAVDAILFMGLPAFGRLAGVPNVSWVQGPPGTDANSLDAREDLLRQTEGRTRFAMLKAYGRFRMSVGLPNFGLSDRIIVGSQWAAGSLVRRFDVPAAKVVALPYPIDLSKFEPRSQPGPSMEPLNVLWLGRIVPRKRLDLLLAAADLALRQNVPLRVKVVGGFTFAPGLKSLLDKFPHPAALEYVANVPREAVQRLFETADVLCQPSDDENFGSSVAEALACGIPTIVGATNGTGDYIPSESYRLADDRPETLAAVFADCVKRKRDGTLINVARNREHAEKVFSVTGIVSDLEEVIRR